MTVCSLVVRMLHAAICLNCGFPSVFLFTCLNCLSKLLNNVLLHDSSTIIIHYTVVFAGKVTFTFYFKSKKKVQYFLLFT